ncbi:MAG: FAD-dependent oxidoreductase [Verrucomicrobiota bacterium]|nr:FAD-dependent oxidoreductase [Verrucomicrobiota bacterium]
MKDFDLIVIGGGSAGYAAARTFQEEGGNVAIVDGGEELSGLCILRGCMPSKTLIYSAEMLHIAKQGKVFGFECNDIRADMASIQRRKKEIITEFADYRKGQLKDGRFSLFHSSAWFLDEKSVRMKDGTVIRADKFIISTGSKISMPPVLGLDQVSFKTSDDVLDLSEIPEEVVVLGGGIVACELSQFLHRIGCSVTILQRNKNILKGFPEKASTCVLHKFREEGMIVKTGSSIERLEQTNDTTIRVDYLHDEEKKSIETKFLFHALGRTPATDRLNLSEIGVRIKKSGHIQTNAFQQTSVPHIYAAGDCAGPHEIVHIAIRQGETAANHALGKATEPISYDHLLGVVFTDPQVASVGFLPGQLDEKGIEYLSADYPFDDHGKSILMEAKHGYVAVHAEKKTGVVLGAECVGKDAGELIHTLSLAVSMRATVHQLARADWYHPTLSEIWTYPIEDLAEIIDE